MTIILFVMHKDGGDTEELTMTLLAYGDAYIDLRKIQNKFTLNFINLFLFNLL